MKYDQIHKVLGEGNLVLVVSEGSFAGAATSFYDLFRVENGKIAEHWDTIEAIPDSIGMEERQRQVRVLMEETVSLVTHLASLVVIAVVGAHVASGTVSAQTASADSFACDRQCLSTAMDDFVKAVTTVRAGSITLADNAEVRENAAIVPIGNTTWARVKTVRSIVSIADVSTGNVVSRAGVELIDGTAGYSLNAPESRKGRPSTGRGDQC